MFTLRRALKLSLAFASLLSVSALAAERALPASSDVENPAGSGVPAAAGFLAELSCSLERPGVLSPEPLPMVLPPFPVACGVCSEPVCVGASRGEDCNASQGYVCVADRRCTEDNLSHCTCGILQPI